MRKKLYAVRRDIMRLLDQSDKGVSELIVV